MIFVSFMIFVNWKKGPQWWTKYSPYLYFAMIIIVYLVLPVLNISAQIVVWCDTSLD